MTKAIPLPPLEELEQLLDYNPDTGALLWKQSRGTKKKGAPAGSITPKGYLRVRLNKSNFMVHRLAWYMAYKVDPGSLQIDHVNQNKVDNRISNLRLATNAENAQNRAAPKSNTSGYKGVARSGSKWQARIGVPGRLRYLGTFPTPELAHMAYCKAAAELHGEFARAA